ncbi:ACT domain-containing protein [Methanohalophilus sp. RSK]|uniref:ACT domain-containing protein n=1 Tax=Methanohalophilus sp. RSK TaxID=2485783 RepID=UPI0018F2AA74
MDFGQIGILARISNTLSENGISIFVMSTYDTDYIFVKQINCEVAFSALEAAGMKIEK